MTDESAITPPDDVADTPPEQPGITIPQLWATMYEYVLVTLVGNTVNKADRQQYRLKAAEVALALTNLEVRR